MKLTRIVISISLFSLGTIFRQLTYFLLSVDTHRDNRHRIDTPALSQAKSYTEEPTQNYAITLKWNSTERPPREMFVDNNQVKPEAQFLIDFAIVGFAKAGTTTLGSWLHQHPQIKTNPHENFNFRNGPIAMTNSMYRNLPDSFDPWLKKGYRCPLDIVQPVMMRHIRNYYPSTKLIVTIRNPIEWFQSFYNYRLSSGEARFLKGTPNELIGSLKCCIRDPNYLSTSTGEMHKFLARLGKTPLSSNGEISLLAPFADEKSNVSKPDFNQHVPNPVFLLDMHQLGDTNETRSMQLRRDLTEYLNLDKLLSPIPHIRPNSNKEKSQNVTKIDLCEEQYLPVKTELLRISRASSVWIRSYFLDADGVHLSSREYLEEILRTWMSDPCTYKRRRLETK
jgi:hypothetical protein